LSHAQIIVIGGKRCLWRDILKVRREQRKEARKAQLLLFELKTDARPPSQQSAAGRYQEPTLFKVD
jgi:hypothetical protein